MIQDQRKKASYPTEAWKALSPEDKAFMRELKQVFGNVRYEGEHASTGIIPFKETEWARRSYWLCES